MLWDYRVNFFSRFCDFAWWKGWIDQILLINSKIKFLYFTQEKSFFHFFIGKISLQDIVPLSHREQILKSRVKKHSCWNCCLWNSFTSLLVQDALKSKWGCQAKSSQLPTKIETCELRLTWKNLHISPQIEREKHFSNQNPW